MKTDIELEFDLMPDGTIRFSRNDPQVNERIFEILSQVAPDRVAEIREFLDGALSIERIFGDDPLCG